MPSQPLRTLALAGYPLRIYASPMASPDHPWASFDDLAAIAEADDDMRAGWRAQLRHDVSDLIHDLPDGTTLIAEPLVGGLFQAWVMMGAGRAQALLDQWTEAWSELFAAQFAQLPREEWLQVVEAAALRNVVRVPGQAVQ